jgi:hypothetical protein
MRSRTSHSERLILIFEARLSQAAGIGQGFPCRRDSVIADRYCIQPYNVRALRSFLFLLILGASFLTACAPKPPAPTAAPTGSPTPDPCGAARLPGNAGRVHELTRAFDDAYQLASSLPRSQVASQISQLQTIRRAAQDQAVPTCLVQLKKLQLAVMNAAIATLLSFVGGADANTVNQGIAGVRQQHDLYTIELARLLGVTVVAQTAPPPGTPAPSGTTGAQAPNSIATQAPSTAGLTATNPGPNPVNLRASASMTSAVAGSLAVGQSAAALGKTPSGEWILIGDPGPSGRTAWVYATLVKLSGDPSVLPVITPSP